MCSPLDVCIKRDPKGLYAKAHRGEISHVTCLSDPYEEPNAPDISVATDQETPQQSVDKISPGSPPGILYLPLRNSGMKNITFEKIYSLMLFLDLFAEITFQADLSHRRLLGFQPVNVLIRFHTRFFQ